MFRDVEVRAGLDPVPDGFNGQNLTVNKRVGFVPGPGVTGATYTVKFDATTTALYVTLQITDDTASRLEINELIVLQEGKKNVSHTLVFIFLKCMSDC